MNAIETARLYIGYGWKVIPVLPPCWGKCEKAAQGKDCSCGKLPADKKWPDLNITNDSAPRYFRQDSNIGVVLGDGSNGLVDIDLDCPEAVDLAPKFLPPSAEFGRAGSPRSHRLYYCHGIRTEKFQQPMGVVDGKARSEMLVELRANKVENNGKGLQTVFPGSVHPSGEKIEWDTRDSIRAIEKVTPDVLRTQVARLAAASMLVRLGWERDRAIAWGRSPAEGPLQSLTQQNHNVIARWLGLGQRHDSPTAPQQIDQRLKRAEAYLAKIPGGVSGAGGHQQTWSAALAVVRGFDLTEGEAYLLLAGDFNRRCDPPWSEKELRHKIADAANNARLPRGYLLNEQRPNGIVHRPAQPIGQVAPLPPAEWDAPIEFDAFDLPPFPVNALPPQLANFVRACAEATQTPPDMAGMLVLSACAAACAKRLEVEVKPGYREPVNLFTAVVLPPGERKSSVVREATLPLIQWEAKAAQLAAPGIARAAQRWTISKKRLDSITDKAAKARGKEEREALELEVEELTEEHQKLVVPVEPRILADDATPEALASLLAAHGGRIAIFSAEGGVFQQMAGKYSDSPNLDVYLKAHAGDEIRVDRKGRPSERIAAPALTLGLAIQPSILEALAEKPMLRGTGLLARFLYAMPTSMIGSRRQDAPPIPGDIRAAYSSALSRLLDLQDRKEPLVLKLSTEAYQEWCRFAEWLEPQLSEFGELASIRDWAGKLAGAVARISGLEGVFRISSTISLNSHFEDHIISIYIDREAMVHAIDLGKYLLCHAQAAIASMGANPDHQAAKHILRWIAARSSTAFTRSDVQQSTRRATVFDEPERLDRALNLLADRQFIRRSTQPMQGPGRPSIRFEVNPRWAGRILESGTENPGKGFDSVSNETNNEVSQVMEREPGEEG